MKYAIICIIAFALCSCTSTGIFDTDIVAGNAQATGRLEATIEALDRTAADSRERIKSVISASRSIEDGIARVEFLFGCYEREVDILLREMSDIREQAEAGN